MWDHYTLIKYFKEETDEEEDAKAKGWKLSLRGRRLIDESARVAEAIASQHEDRMDTHRAQATVWNMWETDRKVRA